MIPGPRPSQGHPCPSTDGDDARQVPVSLTRTPRGWSVHSAVGLEEADDLVEGLSLADLVAEELGVLTEPDRTARRSARGAADAEDDGIDARVAALERTVAQLEHALAARVSTERAIGVLAERHGTSARAAFETLRHDARSQGRPVAELAREVLDGLPGAGPEANGHRPRPRAVPAGARPPGSVVAAVSPPAPRIAANARSTAAADGRS